MITSSPEKPSGLQPRLNFNLTKTLKIGRKGAKPMEKGVAANPEIKQKVVAYLETIQKAKSKEIAVAIGEKKSDVDLAVKELSMEDIVEYLYITTTFIALKGKVGAPD